MLDCLSRVAISRFRVPFAVNPFGNGTMTKRTGTLSEIACVRARSRIANANRVLPEEVGRSRGAVPLAHKRDYVHSRTRT